MILLFTAGAKYWLDTIRERRGLMAMQAIRRDDVMISVPWSKCLSSEHLENKTDHPLSSIAKDYRDRLLPADLLAIFLLYEYHNPQSEWAPYLCA